MVVADREAPLLLKPKAPGEGVVDPLKHSVDFAVEPMGQPALVLAQSRKVMRRVALDEREYGSRRGHRGPEVTVLDRGVDLPPERGALQVLVESEQASEAIGAARLPLTSLSARIRVTTAARSARG